MSNKPNRRTILTRETTAVSIVAALACVLSSEANASRPAAEATILRDLPAVTKMAQWRNR
jgi:hypothetical protein